MKENQSSSPQQAELLHDAEEILHLKRLLVTLKQHYEKSIQQIQIQLQTEVDKRKFLEQEILIKEKGWEKECLLHAEELQALHEQQEVLKSLLVKSSEESPLETVISSTSSHHLRSELELIKKTLLDQAQEAKAFESRYIEVLNEKIGLEHHCKQLQIQMEHQLSNLSGFQEELHKVGQEKKEIESALQKEKNALIKVHEEFEQSLSCMQVLQKGVEEKEFVQEKYEQLKEEWQQLNSRIEDELEMRSKAELYISELEEVVSHQKMQLQQIGQDSHLLLEEKLQKECEMEEIKALVGDKEGHLKMAQQHLAKKVKEFAILEERYNEQQIEMKKCVVMIEGQKMEIMQLQQSIDFLQSQEQQLQEDLRQMLKGNENQAMKWEEKYFQMYDKWQESENLIRELKKFEEKHLQMQSLLSNLGNFMGGSTSSHRLSFSEEKELEHPLNGAITETFRDTKEKLTCNESNDKYDLFGLRPIRHKKDDL